ncbi:MAG: Gfo/Idh/MocA family oxidoreductase [Ruminococcaceae bacterium]|nr:Gfo/Idh/MocA family oxidoreductase [Oscillospiraceae bacterium]
MKKLKYGMIGFGCRGLGLLKAVLLPMQTEESLIETVAVCDLYEDRANDAAKALVDAGCERPFVTTDYKQVLDIKEIDAVIISAAWEAHIDIAVAAMKAGKYVGLEVGGAYSIEDCWRLVNTSEETGVHCMLLENCCYGKRELMALNMYRQGALGDVVHCEGGYHHDLRYEISNGKENRHYRLRNYMNRNCENYPTHEFGPIAKILDINNGNRILSLSSTASCSKGLHEYITQNREESDPLYNAQFAQGDVVTTIMKTAKGQTVTIVLDTTLPRAYSRGFTIRGTKGAYFEDTDSVFIDGEHNKFEWEPKKLWGNAAEYEDKYLHTLWKNYVPRGGHDGMDWMVFHAFYEAVSKNVRPPIDVYDAALYMSITALSEQSISMGGAVLSVPDFTHGKWHNRSDIEELEYGIDDIKEYIR